MVANRKGAQFRISEIYGSVQGEGLLTGTPSTFIRTSGCNLRCWFCDTRFASWEPEGPYLDVSNIINQVEEIGHQHVVLTGGEPMVYNRIGELARAIVEAGKHLTIETAGTIFHEIPCDLFSISPKLSSSAPQDDGTWAEAHEARRERIEVVKCMMNYPYQLKFVIDSLRDTEEVLNYLERLSDYDPSRVLLMPQGTELANLEAVESWLKPWCGQHGFVFCPREHIRWFGNQRGT